MIVMPSLIVSTQVSAPLKKVFGIFTEVDKAAERIPAISKLEMLSDGPFGDGTRWRETRLMKKCMLADLEALRDVCVK